MTYNRRLFLRGLVAAPAIVAASSLMPIRGIVMPIEWSYGRSITNAEASALYYRALKYWEARGKPPFEEGDSEFLSPYSPWGQHRDYYRFKAGVDPWGGTVWVNWHHIRGYRLVETGG